MSSSETTGKQDPSASKTDWSQVQVCADGEIRPAPESADTPIRLHPSCYPPDPIYELQQKCGALLPWHRIPETAEHCFQVARWSELEASRGYGSARSTLWGARNLIDEGWRRVQSGEIRPVSKPPHVPRCTVCQGPSEGLWGCGGPVVERVGKFDTRTVCSASGRSA